MAVVLPATTEVRRIHVHHCVHTEMPVYEREEDSERQHKHVSTYMHIIVFSIICEE